MLGRTHQSGPSREKTLSEEKSSFYIHLSKGTIHLDISTVYTVVHNVHVQDSVVQVYTIYKWTRFEQVHCMT